MSAQPDIQVVITLPESQYDDLAEDLDTLRKAGAESNTAAIIAAVHQQADKLRAQHDE